MSEHFGSLLPWRADDLRVLEAKILLKLNEGGLGGVPQVFAGHYGGIMPSTPTPDASVTAAFNYDLDSPFATWKWDSVAQNWGG